MASDMAAMLDELMGRDRNLLPSEAKEYHFYDDDVCKYYLVGLCPHDLFVNTKNHLGPCPKRHDDSMVAQWEAETDKTKYSYERDLVAYAETLISNLEKIKQRNMDKLEFKKKKYSVGTTHQESPDELRIAAILAETEVLLKRIEACGEQGLIDEAEALNAKMEGLNAEKAQLQRRIEQERAAANGADRNLSVCDICGTYLSEAEVGDRLVNHTEGKQHRGFALLRERIAAYNKYRPPSSERTDRYSQSRDPLDVRGSSRERPSRERRRSSSRDRHSDRRYDRRRDYHRDRRDYDRRDSRRDYDRDRRRSRESDRDYDSDRYDKRRRY